MLAEVWYNFSIMALLSVNNLACYFGASKIFDNLSLDVHAGECVALVGKNGCGKSTLLNIIAKKLESDAGSVNRSQNTHLGYLPQVPDFNSDGSLWDAMLDVFSHLRTQQAELHKLEAAMASEDKDTSDAALERYGVLLDAFELAGGFTYEGRIGKVLGGLGFHKDEFSKPVAHLSGGEKTRALLARLLLEEPDLLLLDEPTNHLDLEGIEWLEDQLKGWKGAILVAAHDRAFLDNIATRVIEMARGKLDSYRGNYTAYTQQREAKHTLQRAAYAAQQAHIEKTEDYIHRNMAGQRTRQAKGRLRRLNRLERLDNLQEDQKLHMNLQATLRSGDLVLGLYKIAAGYEDEDPLVSVDEVEIRRGQRVALVGPNGSGKTTLLRTILERIPPQDGKVRIGAAVRPGYFAQIQEHLSMEKTMLDTMVDEGIHSIAEARSYLARYGFRGDDVYKEIGVLSGGERARVALAILTLQKANFLILDEPTNHLDISSQEVLQNVIANFKGTVLLVSHDRYLIREAATQVWALADGQLYAFTEGYPAYAAWHQKRREGGSGSTAAKKSTDKTKSRRETERRAKRDKERSLARQKKQLDTIEAQIQNLETRMQELTIALDSAGREQNVTRVTKLGAEYHKVEAQLNTLLEQWAETADSPL